MPDRARQSERAYARYVAEDSGPILSFDEWSVAFAAGFDAGAAVSPVGVEAQLRQAKPYDPATFPTMDLDDDEAEAFIRAAKGEGDPAAWKALGQIVARGGDDPPYTQMALDMWTIAKAALAVSPSSPTGEDDPARKVREMRDKAWALRKPDGSSGPELDEFIAYCDRTIAAVEGLPPSSPTGPTQQTAPKVGADNERPTAVGPTDDEIERVAKALCGNVEPCESHRNIARAALTAAHGSDSDDG